MNWKGDPTRIGAGPLFEYGSHGVDLAQWLVGPVERVSSSLTRVLPGAKVDDIAILQIKFAPPFIGALVCGWVLAGCLPGIKMRVHGSKGAAEVEIAEIRPGGEEYRELNLDGVVPTYH